jgi:hypothetical protein
MKGEEGMSLYGSVNWQAFSQTALNFFPNKDLASQSFGVIDTQGKKQDDYVDLDEVTQFKNKLDQSKDPAGSLDTGLQNVIDKMTEAAKGDPSYKINLDQFQNFYNATA